MTTTSKSKNQWYVVHVISGHEGKVRDRLKMRIQTEEMGDDVGEILIPSETVSEIKRGTRSKIKRKFFPGYIIVNLNLLDENNGLIDKTWYFIKETEGVLGFAGNKNKPKPLKEKEIKNLLAQASKKEDSVKPKIEFEVGDSVKVSDGPFQNQAGIVEEIDQERGKLRVSVTIFGRATPVDLEYWQVEKTEG